MPMRTKYRGISLGLVFILAVVFARQPLALRSQESGDAQKEIPVTSWLAVGPFPTPLPAFASGGTKTYGLADLLKFEPLDLASLAPSEGGKLIWPSGEASAWTVLQAGDKGIEWPVSGKFPETAFLAVYLSATEWSAVKLSIACSHPFQVFLDGRSIASKSASDKKTDAVSTSGAGPKTSADLKLEAGRHLLIIKALRDPDNVSAWTVQASLAPDGAAPTAVVPSPSADDRMSLRHLLDSPQVSDVSLSDDGSLAVLSLSRVLPSGTNTESWLEIYDVASGNLLKTYRGGADISSLKWVPGRRSFSFVSREKEESSLWLADLDKGSVEPLLENVKGLGSITWAKDGSFLVYSQSEEPEKDPEGVRRFRNLADRQPFWRRLSFLYKLKVPEKTRQKLTAGDRDTDLTDISPDGKSLLIGRTLIDYGRRPYNHTELEILDLETLESSPLWKGAWFSGAEWSPDGRRILFLGGPSLFGAVGTNVPKGVIPNDYDTQAYLFDPSSRTAVPLTRDFDPSVNDAVWSPDGRSLYLSVTDKSYVRLYRYDLDSRAFTPIDCGKDIVRSFRPAENAPVGVFLGSGPNDPPKAYILELEKNTVHPLRDPGREDYARVKFGPIEPWSFKNKRGRDIEGLIYFPPDFDPSKTYPCIVNYYGGTTPISRDFGGRYPHEYYAALGYVVYILQPSGAVGYGQAFSALHVNDWGIIVADEIIDGVKKFLASHPYVDPKKVGCIGASYGGFMTMLLVTRTDIFAAAVSHAGISSISSYWGEGYWGYGYNAVAAAGSFPWNRRDVYINQSPLFHADKIKTPMLLLHGSADTNVPPGESTQMFTALKLLGREVEYIQVLDQDHHILNHNKRLTWTRTIMAWFDRWLKGRPAWWKDLYPSK